MLKRLLRRWFGLWTPSAAAAPAPSKPKCTCPPCRAERLELEKAIARGAVFVQPSPGVRQ